MIMESYSMLMLLKQEYKVIKFLFGKDFSDRVQTLGSDEKVATATVQKKRT